MALVHRMEHQEPVQWHAANVEKRVIMHAHVVKRRKGWTKVARRQRIRMESIHLGLERIQSLRIRKEMQGDHEIRFPSTLTM